MRYQNFSAWSGSARAALAIVALALALGGCASTYTVDSQVQAFSSLPQLPPQPTYRFERLPSQQAAPDQTQVEAIADGPLYRAGLRRDDAKPRFSVQVNARAQRVVSPWSDPWDWGGPFGGPWAGGAWGGGWGHPGWGAGFGYSSFGRYERPWYQREVGVVVRDLTAGNRVVFESRAANDSPWYDTGAVLAAMFDAALQGFPVPPPGPRRVDIRVGPSNTTALVTQPATVAPAASPTSPAPPATGAPVRSPAAKP